MRPSRFALLILVAAGLAIPAAPSVAQPNEWVPGKRFQESATRVLGTIEKGTRENPYGYVNGICFLSAFLHTGREAKFYREFEAGVPYLLAGGGDNGTKDLDLYIIDQDGQVVAKDELTDNFPVVRFTPTRSARYIIRMVMHDAGPNGGFGSVGILRRNGIEVPVRNQAAALAGLIDEANKVDRLVPETVLFSSGEGQWAVYGSILAGGADMTINSLTPGRGTRYWVCGADDTADDVDLYLYDRNDRLIKKDERIDPPRPRLTYQTAADEAYGVRIRNVQSRRPSLILVGTLTLSN
jgi:hypothetical protein